MSRHIRAIRDCRRSEAGYNLIEVLIAIAILGTVLISVVMLFVMGRKNVYSGKQMTLATSIATRAVEDLSSLRKDNIWTAFGITDASTLGSVDIDTTRTMAYDTYSDAILRTTKDITTETDPGGYLQRWKDAIDNESKLGQGSLSLVIQPRQPALVSGNLVQTPSVTGSVIKMRVVVRWVEGLRPRQVVMDTVKIAR